MKNISKDDVIQRIDDKKAHKRVTEDGWKYVPNSVWKKEVRDFEKPKKDKK